MANGGGEKDFVDELLGMARSVDLERLPSSVVRAGRRVLIDVIGSMLAAISEERLRLLAGEMSCASAKPSSTILGSPHSADPAWAALVNATAAVWHDVDPGHRFSGGNPAVYPVAAGLAVAEREGASGKRLLEAVIGGYELGARTGLGATLRGGMDSHGSWPIVGGAVAAAALTSPDRACFRHAVNIVTTFTIASSRKATLEGASVRNIYAGFGAAMGVVAADLAQDGFTAERDGLSTVFGTIAGEYLDVDNMMESLGQRWEIERGCHSPHAGLRDLHPALDALISIARHGGGIPVGEIERIEVRTYDLAAAMNSVAPENSGAAKASIPWAIGAYLALGAAGPAAYSAESLANGKIRDLAAKVHVQRDPVLDARTPAQRPAVVKVCLRDGREFVNGVERPSGEFDTNPLSDEDLREKFVSAAALPLGVEKANQLLDALSRIEEIADVRQFTALCKTAGA
jgi:2-methylcitrate dehydratase PrpD